MVLTGHDFFSTKNVIGALVPLTIVAGCGLALIRPGTALAVCFCATGIVVAVAVEGDPRYQREDYRSAAHLLVPRHYPRAIIETPGYYHRIGEPLRVYLSSIYRMRVVGQPVREIDVLGMAHKPNGGSYVPPSPMSAPMLSPFRLVARVRKLEYTLLEYRSPRLVVIRPVELARSHLGEGPVTVWYEPPNT